MNGQRFTDTDYQRRFIDFYTPRMPKERPPTATTNPGKAEERERQPSHKVYSVEPRENDEDFWTRIGSAWPLARFPRRFCFYAP